MLPIGPHQLKNRFFLAPMAGVSERPFRVIAFQQGAALATTELISAQGLFRLTNRTMRYLRYDPSVERPYSLQLFGGEPEAMAKAAVVAKQYGAEIIDINMGCPVKKVTKTGAGSSLMCDSGRAGEIVRQIKAATGLPVTAKIRSGWDANNRNFLEMADVLGAAGVAALAVHPRTRAQGYSGKADWTVIRDLKRHVGNSFPIVGNGDVKTVADAHRMLDETGCDYVMIGRGALGNPWIFRELNGGSKPTPQERCDLVLAHFKAHLHHQSEARIHKEQLEPEERAAKDERMGVHSFRSHLAWYAHGLYGAAAFRAQVMKLDTAQEVAEAVQRFFVGADVDAQAMAADQEDVDYRAALG